jgi:hypothetical protein
MANDVNALLRAGDDEHLSRRPAMASATSSSQAPLP